MLKAAKRPAIIVGAGALAREDGAAMLEAVGAGWPRRFNVVREGWNGFNVLHTAAARVGGLDLGFVPGEGGMTAPEMVRKGALDVLFLLGADEIDLSQTDAFVIYLGSHGDRGAHRADVILPGAAYTEKTGIYVNTEGRVQLGSARRLPQGRGAGGLGDPARAVRAAWATPCRTTPWTSSAPSCSPTTRPSARSTMCRAHRPPRSSTRPSSAPRATVGDAPFASPVKDFFQTNPIARASVTMAECSALAAHRGFRPMAAE